ncbi:MAG: Fe-S cluster assembly protein SufD [Bacteroidales bacterium]|nr:Fe-S cluster assembly protein SufD [Bacteroidales bacterium]
MAASEQYKQLLEEHLSLINKRASQPMNNAREGAIKTFLQYGIPSQKEELFRHINIEKLYTPDYGINLARVSQSATQDVYRCSVPGLKTQTIYVIGDIPQACETKSEVEVMNMEQFATQYPQLAETYYNKLAQTSTDGTVALNTALAQDAVVVYIPDGVVMQTPLQIVNVLNSNTPVMMNRRLLIVAGKNSVATILVCEHNLSESQTLATQVTEIFAGENSQIEYYELEETTSTSYKVSSLFAEQESNSNILISPMTLHNGETRANYNVEMVGQGANLNITGLSICDNSQVSDVYTRVHHRASHCESNQLFKNIVSDNAVVSMTGKVLVEKGADKTISQQSNKNISMSQTAHIYTEPQLEIYADDVKCGHGATVGQLDESALFYLRQRGIPEEEARMMLMLAFADDILQRIKLEPLRDRLRSLIENRLRKGDTKCSGCTMCK